MEGFGLEVEESNTVSSNSLSSSEELAPTSSLDIRVHKAWAGLGQTSTSESEAESAENKENIFLPPSSKEIDRAIVNKELVSAPLQEMSTNKTHPDKEEEGSLRLFLEETQTQGVRVDAEDSEDMFADKDDDEDDKEDEVVADQSVIETFSVQRNLTPSNSGTRPGVPDMDESVIFISPSPKKDPSLIELDDSYQDADLKLDLESSQPASNSSTTVNVSQPSAGQSQALRVGGSQPLGVRDTQLLGAGDSRLSGIFNEDIDQMIAEDDDVQNMPNMIELDDAQPSKDAIYLEQGLFDQRLDLNAVMSPMPRHHQVGASPLKFKNDITTVISPLKVKSDHGISNVRSEVQERETEAVAKPSSRADDAADIANSDNDKPDKAAQTVQETEVGGANTEHQSQNLSSSEERETIEGAEQTEGTERLESQQLKRKAAEALSSEDETRKKKDLKDGGSGAGVWYDKNKTDQTSSSSHKLPHVNGGSDTAPANPGAFRETPPPPHLVPKETLTYSSERPSSQNEVSSPDISCSPIMGRPSDLDHHQQHSSGGERPNKLRKTSTPGKKNLSSPQKLLRQKLIEPNAGGIDSSEDDLRPSERRGRQEAAVEPPLTKVIDEAIDGRKTRAEGSKTPSPDNTLSPPFKEPVPLQLSQQRLHDSSIESAVNRLMGIQFKTPAAAEQINSLLNSLINRIDSLAERGEITERSSSLKKRVSDASILTSSSGTSLSGYQGSGESSSGSSELSKRSRQSLNPEEAIAPHRTPSRLPNQKKHYYTTLKEKDEDSTLTDLEDKQLIGSTSPEPKPSTEPIDKAEKQDKHDKAKRLSSDESGDTIVAQSGSTEKSPAKKFRLPNVEVSVERHSIGGGGGKKKVKPETLKEPIDETQPNKAEAIEPAVTPPSKKTESKPTSKRSRKANSSSSNDSARKRLKKKRVNRKSSDDDDDFDDDDDGGLTKLAEKRPSATPTKSATSRLTQLEEPGRLSVVPGDRVFGRWTDPAGVYFYAARVVDRVNDSEVKVQFLEDKIERVLRVESELIKADALRPNDQITIKHDLYIVYDVTAQLMTFPSLKPDGDVEYEVQIVPDKDNPPHTVDSRMVNFSEVSLSDQQASLIIRGLGFVPASNKVSANLDFNNLIYGKRRPRTVVGSTSSAADGSSTPGKSSSGRSPGLTPKKTPRRKKGGSNIEESASSSVAELSGTEASKRKKKSIATTTEEEEQDNESLAKRSKKSSRGGVKSSAAKPISPDLFKGMSFILTQSKEEEMPRTDQENSDGEAEQRSAGSEPKFEKSKLRAFITQGGGKVLQEFPTQDYVVNTMGDDLITISDRMCLTMNYLLSLAHKVPVVSFRYILDCVSKNEKLNYRPAYLLPAGKSSLLMEDIEQGQNCRPALLNIGCLQPSVSTSTRLSNKSKDADLNKKILSGLHILVLTETKEFASDWQNVLDSLGARVTKGTSSSARLTSIRPPDVVIVVDRTAPQALAGDLRRRTDIPVVNTNWPIQCIINSARLAYENFECDLP